MPAFCFTDRENAFNEDFVACGEGFGVLLDGASGLAEDRLFAHEAPTYARWLSQTAGAEAARLLKAGASCRDAAHGAYELVARQYAAQRAVSNAEPDPLLAPSATLAMARLTPLEVELLWMGDSPLVVVLRDRIDVLYDPEIRALDAKALTRAEELRRFPGNEGRPARELVRDMLSHHRMLRNQPGGYRIFDPLSGDPMRGGTQSYDRTDVVAVLGMSDGMMAAFDAYGMRGLEAFCRAATLQSTESLVCEMRVLERTDSKLECYPRFKMSDDASLFCLSVSE